MKSLVILASGAGSNAERIIRYLQDSGQAIHIKLISDRRSSGVFSIAESTGVSATYMPYSEMRDGGLLTSLEKETPDLIVLAGFLRMIPEGVVQAFEGRVVNIHPSLLPKYGGAGMYGDHVHRAVLESGDPESGITIHLVNEEFDKGRIIAQFCCELNEADSMQTLKKKIQKLEHRYFPYVIETLLNL